MRWFEKGYDRGNVADNIMNVGPVEVVCRDEQGEPTLRRTKMRSKEFRVTCILNHYTQWQAYDAQKSESVSYDNPFHMAQLEYDRDDGTRVNALLRFNQEHTMVARSSEYIRRNVDQNPDESWKIWDETVWLLDEALSARAQQVGLLITARMVERPSENPQALWTPATAVA